MDFSFQALVLHHNAEMNSAFRSVVDTIIRNSQLSVSLLRISNVTEDSFHVTLEARITKTGPANAKITPMTVDLCGPSGRFGSVTLPAMTLRANGTDVIVDSQLVKILDKEALRIFVQAIVEDGVTLSLRNGRASVSALGVGPRDIVYEKELGLQGMKGPAVRVRAANIINPLVGPPSMTTLGSSSTAHLNPTSLTTIDLPSTVVLGSRNNYSIVFQVANPSPVEISFGTCSFDIETHEGKVLAELKGRLGIRRNQFEVTFQGNVNKTIAAQLAADMRAAGVATGGSEIRGAENEGDRSGDRTPEARLVGKRCAGAGWCDDTIKGINVPLQNVRALFQALGVDADKEEPVEKKGSPPRWMQRWMIR
ncbi:hypothetical protein ANO14919_051820 [Xylariales sp. No.14919]|nr:hypothetical protein F5X98DRAFT_360647 [Xylaria grammica]GAW15762.1 hypothetical protein ANO14919_051820 [Xylariales sp. No.14919]